MYVPELVFPNVLLLVCAVVFWVKWVIFRISRVVSIRMVVCLISFVLLFFNVIYSIVYCV